MKRKFPLLSSPLKIGNVTLRNRMISSPMAYPDITPEGHVTEDASAFYELRAKGGAAAVTMSEAITHIKTGMSHSKHINLEDPGVLAGLTKAARAIKRHGALANIEISHGGKYANVDIKGGGGKDAPVRYGPSAEKLASGVRIEEMSKTLIREIVASFGKGAAVVKQAGFDMVLIHGGHGWLIQQFFSPATNKRTDEYGGSLENRTRLALEVIKAVRDAVGPGFPIEFRMSAEEHIPGGYKINDAIEFAKMIESGVDLLHVSTGAHENSFAITHPSMFLERGVNVHLAAQIKKHVSVPVACIGALNDPHQMEEILASGKADVVEMARALLADPFLPKKVMLGQDEEITRCIRCFTCLAERVHTQTRICAVNPVIGREYESRFALPPAEKKKVLVVGGGPGGMETALIAARRGHEVTLYEKSGELGGALKYERAIAFKQDLYHLAKSLEIQVKKAGVKVIMNTAVTPELVEKAAPDVLVLAVGAAPILPPIPGIDSPNVVVANDLSEEGLNIGKTVVMLGGGMVGCESSVHLAQEGRHVTIVEMDDDVAKDANVRQKPILMQLFDELGIKTEIETRGIAVTEDGLLCEDKNGRKKLIKADTVICAVGQRPLREVVDTMLDSAPEVMQVGDCVKPQRVTEALSRGYHAGMDI